MIISFFNPSDLIGCGGDINQSESFRYVEGVRGGGMWRGYMEGGRGGDMRRVYAEGVHAGVSGGGMWRGMRRGYVEGVHRGGT